MSVLASLFRQSGGAIIEAYVRETPLDSYHHSPDSARITQLELVFSGKSAGGEDIDMTYPVALIRPSRRQKRHYAGEKLCLTHYTRGQEIGVEQGYELYLLNEVMRLLAQADPRIRESKEEPLVQISRIGQQEFDLQEMRRLYSIVTSEYRAQKATHRRLGNPNWPHARM